MEDFRNGLKSLFSSKINKIHLLKNNAEILASPQRVIWNSQTHKALHSKQKHARKALGTKAGKFLV